ncbi:hypothetical protein DW322_19955 [Rhodococcus rhodnii]|uniref:Protein kinase n=1 Tax=Rhodococcus rhodnii TaxID=38312 RepID=A0A6P2CKN9_9NOCA|nr:hypothetical protein DW322_19955 [Rhodococcus rhodnii]
MRVAGAAAVVLGTALGLSAVGAGAASAQPAVCVSPPSDNDIQVHGTASCGAKASDGGWVQSGAIDSGTAVGVAQGPDAQTQSYASGYGTALGASTGGQAWALALGGGIAHSGAAPGALTIAIAGWGSGATADVNGVDCTGALSFAANLQTGQVCAFR